LIVFC